MYDEMRPISPSSKLVQVEKMSLILCSCHTVRLKVRATPADRSLLGKSSQTNRLTLDLTTFFRSLYSRALQTQELRTSELSHNMFTTSKNFDSPFVVRDDGTAHPYR